MPTIRNRGLTSFTCPECQSRNWYALWSADHPLPNAIDCYFCKLRIKSIAEGATNVETCMSDEGAINDFLGLLKTDVVIFNVQGRIVSTDITFMNSQYTDRVKAHHGKHYHGPFGHIYIDVNRELVPIAATYIRAAKCTCSSEKYDLNVDETVHELLVNCSQLVMLEENHCLYDATLNSVVARMCWMESLCGSIGCRMIHDQQLTGD